MSLDPRRLVPRTGGITYVVSQVQNRQRPQESSTRIGMIRFTSDKTRRLFALRAEPDSIPEALGFVGNVKSNGMKKFITY